MKFYLLVILFIAFVLIAIYVYFRYYFRFVFYKDIYYVCRYIKNNISFNKNQIDVIINDSLINVSFFTKYLFKSNSNNMSLLINKKDLAILEEFIESIGKGDIDYENNNISYYENYFNEYRVQAQEKFKMEYI